MSQFNKMIFVVVLLTPALASASAGTVEFASNGLWIGLAVVGAVRALMSFASVEA